MVGGSGNDTYLFSLGDGNTTIYNLDTSNSTDTLQLGAGIATTDVQTTRVGNNLLLQVSGSDNTTETITIYNHFLNDDNQLDQIEFADGTVWTTTQIDAALLFVGDENNNTLNGGSGNDRLEGLGGNDTLYGQNGNRYPVRR